MRAGCPVEMDNYHCSIATKDQYIIVVHSTARLQYLSPRGDALLQALVPVGVEEQVRLEDGSTASMASSIKCHRLFLSLMIEMACLLLADCGPGDGSFKHLFFVPENIVFQHSKSISWQHPPIKLLSRGKLSLMFLKGTN